MRGFIWANVFIGILLVRIDASVPLQKVHQKLFHEPVPETFDTPEILPGDEAEPIDQLHISKRSVEQQSSLHLKSLGNDIGIWIVPPDSALFTLNTPVYSIRSSPKGLKYRVYKDIMKTYGVRILDDFLAAYHYKRVKRQIDENKVDDLEDILSIQNQINHVIGLNNTSEGSSRTKRSYGDVIYPEILVIVDYAFFKLHGKNIYNTVKYLYGFWNGVDLEYRLLESPKIRLNIAAIVIALDDTALSYISSNKLKPGHFIVNNAVLDSLSWLYENLSPIIDKNAYDAAITMTPLELCNIDEKSKLCKLGPSGSSAHSGACGVNDYFRLILKTAIVQDKGAFGGIRTAAHELAHLFGASHDSESENFQCSAVKGSIMSPAITLGIPEHTWSQCSLSQIENFLKTKGSCLYNQPNLFIRLIPFMPGKMMDANQQCKILEGTRATQIDETICEALYCDIEDSGYTQSKTRISAASGTRCGDGKICFYNKCVIEPALVIV